MLMAKGQASIIGIAFFLVVFLLCISLVILVTESLSNLMSEAKNVVDSNNNNNEKFSVYVSNYYTLQHSYVQSLNIVKGFYVSGTLTSLNEVDLDYYVIQSPPVGQGGLWRELVKNGDFETGDLSYWTVTTSYNSLISSVTYGVTTTSYGYSAYCTASESSVFWYDDIIVQFSQNFTITGSVTQAQLSFIFKIDFVRSGADVYVKIYIDNNLVDTYGSYTTDTTWITITEDVTKYLTSSGTHTLGIVFEFRTGFFSTPTVTAYLDNVSLDAYVQTIAGLSEILVEFTFNPPQPNFGYLLNVSGYFDLGDPVEVQVIENNVIKARYLFVSSDFSFVINVTSPNIELRLLSVSQFTVHFDLVRLEVKAPSTSFSINIKCLCDYLQVLRVWYNGSYVNVNKVVGYGDTLTVTIPYALDTGKTIIIVTIRSKYMIPISELINREVILSNN